MALNLKNWFKILFLLSVASVFNYIVFINLNTTEIKKSSVVVVLEEPDKVPSLLQENYKDAIIIPDRKNVTDIAVMVMGELSVLDEWYNRMKDIDATFSFIYASFDAQISQEQNVKYIEDAVFPCRVIFTPGTWTEGRNLLAEEAIRLERKRGKQFSHWLFMDDDVVPNCTGREEIINTVYGDGSCWQNVFNFISSSKVPDNASTISLSVRSVGGLQAVSTTDALFAAFKREYVPYILPYGKLREGYSQWMSQAALFCIMYTCLESSTVLVPYIPRYDSHHREYVRGCLSDQMKQVVRDNYVSEELGFEACLSDGYEDETCMQETNKTELVPLEESERFSTLIPIPELTKCAPMKNRFEIWRKGIDDQEEEESDLGADEGDENGNNNEQK